MRSSDEIDNHITETFRPALIKVIFAEVCHEAFYIYDNALIEMEGPVEEVGIGLTDHVRHELARSMSS